MYRGFNVRNVKTGLDNLAPSITKKTNLAGYKNFKLSKLCATNAALHGSTPEAPILQHANNDKNSSLSDTIIKSLSRNYLKDALKITATKLDIDKNLNELQNLYKVSTFKDIPKSRMHTKVALYLNLRNSKRTLTEARSASKTINRVRRRSYVSAIKKYLPEAVAYSTVRTISIKNLSQ